MSPDERTDAPSALQGRHPDLLNVWDYEELAERALDPGVYAYIAEGAGDEYTLRDNVLAFRRYALRPRMLAGVDEASTAVTVFGRELTLPVVVAPVAWQAVMHRDGDLATARAAARAGTVMCVSTFALVALSELAAATPPGTLWFQLYPFRDEGLNRALVEQARAAGCGALVVTVDAQVIGVRERGIRSGLRFPEATFPGPLAKIRGTRASDLQSLLNRSLGWGDIERFAAEAGMPVIVKGLLTAEDAVLACERGAAGVVVSNHGGRQLDGVQASVDALPAIADAVDARAEVFLDGGIRRGSDIVKALALGARAVLLGRPALWGLAGRGEDGVREVLELLRHELAVALTLSGCASPADVTRAHVTP